MHGPNASFPAYEDIRDGLRMYELWLFLGWRDTKKHYNRSLARPVLADAIDGHYGC